MLKHWISEARPRTLLLGLTNCSLGCGLGFYYGAVNLYNLVVAILIVVTGVLLQVIANLANDYGDACKNADRATRQGPIRGVMTGAISLMDLKKAMTYTIIVTCITGALAVFMALYNNVALFAWFLFLGIVAIAAAIFYTVGMAYGYKSLGDLSVFIFFGVAAIIAPQVMLVNISGGGDIVVYPDSVLLAISVGLGSVMVLHVANMRDIQEDKITGKRTIASRLGFKFSAYCHVGLCVFTALSSFLACYLSHKGWEVSILLVALFPLFASVWRVFKNCTDSKKIAKELKYTLLGVSIHNISWLVVLTVDFWSYY